MTKPPAYTRSYSRRTRRGAGFTLVELVVVIVILAIVASIVIPRLVDRSGRAAELSARSLAELVSAMGTRAALGGQRLALRYDDRDRRAVPESWVFAGSPGDFMASGDWTNDSVLTPVTLDGLEIKRITVDGQGLNPSSWRIETKQGAPAPAVSIGVGQPNGGKAWEIELAPGSMRASIRPANTSSGQPSVVDLDAQGLDKEAW